MKRFRWLFMVLAVLVVLLGGVWFVGHRHVNVTVPSDRWQGEVLSAFGTDRSTTLGDESLNVKVSEPEFVKDPEPDRIRLRVNFDVDAGPGAESIKGQLAIRTQLKLDRTIGAVVLSGVQVSDFTLQGQAAGYEPIIRPALEGMLADELEGYPAFKLPKDGPWWQMKGQDLLQNVRVQDGEIVLELGW